MISKPNQENLIQPVSKIIEDAYNCQFNKEVIKKNKSNVLATNLNAITAILQTIYPNQNQLKETPYCRQLAHKLSDTNLEIKFIITGIEYFLSKINNTDHKPIISDIDTYLQKVFNFLNQNKYSDDLLYVPSENINKNTVDLVDREFEKNLLIAYINAYCVYLKFLLADNDKYQNLNKEQRKQIIFETFLIYPTLCDKHHIYYEENLLSEYAFKLIAPDAITNIKNKLINHFFYNRRLFEQIIQKIAKNIQNNCIHAKIYFRVKSYHSIWVKSLTKKLFYDIIGARIITNSIQNCYSILQHMQNLFSVVEVKDFITHPKSNGYQSIHAIISISNQLSMTSCIEIQIRTKSMDEYCKSGIASHEGYKVDKYKKIFENEINS